jgi:transposase
MINSRKREAIKTLYEQGEPLKSIARILKVDIKTVRKAIHQQNAPKNRRDKRDIDDDLLWRLHRECRGYRQRILEILTEEYQIDIGYSTLTRLMNEKGIGEKIKSRSQRVEDIPGEEMQHDTSDYWLHLGGRKYKVIASGLYLRYSKMRYVRFYLNFNRFKMKCFFHVSLTYFGYNTQICLIANTSLAI